MSSSKKTLPVRLNPNLDFIRTLNASGGDSLKKCFQCGTCSATCTISPASSPFPRKEMARAAFGMKEDLISDPDIWLCYQCNDCSERCPRGARPGDVLAAIRKESVIHFAFPRFLARWVNRPRYFPILLAVPAVLLGLAVRFREQLASALNVKQALGEDIVYSHSTVLPHWLLNLFFSSFSALVLIVIVIGMFRFWRAMKNHATVHGDYKKARGLSSSIALAIKRILTHDQFNSCEATRSRFLSHFCVLFGFLALFPVGRTNPINPVSDKLTFSLIIIIPERLRNVSFIPLGSPGKLINSKSTLPMQKENGRYPGKTGTSQKIGCN